MAEMHALALALEPEEGKLGPEMRRLTARQRVFVVALGMQRGRKDAPRAARIAGYSPGKPGSSQLRVQAHFLIHDAKVQAAIQEQARSKVNALTLQAVDLLEDTMRDANSARGDRLKAAAMVLDRGGLHALSEHKIDVNVNDTRAEKLLRVATLAREMGKDPRELLGGLADAIEGDFTVIERGGAVTQSLGVEDGGAAAQETDA